ncbi:MAG: hypothetical protein WAV85_15860, partial [Rhodoferax sp.]
MKGTNRAIILTLLAGLAIPATNVIAEDIPISLEPWNSPNYIEDDDFPLGPLGPHYRVQCISDQIERVNNADARITNLYEEQQGIREKLQCLVDNLKYSEDAYSDTYP